MPKGRGKGKGPPRGKPTLPQNSRIAQQAAAGPPPPASATVRRPMVRIDGFDRRKLKHRETKAMEVDLTAMQQLEKDATAGWAENTAERWEPVLRPFTVPNHVVPMSVAECEALLAGCNGDPAAGGRLARLAGRVDRVIAEQGYSATGVFIKDGIRSPKEEVLAVMMPHATDTSSSSFSLDVCITATGEMQVIEVNGFFESMTCLFNKVKEWAVLTTEDEIPPSAWLDDGRFRVLMEPKPDAELWDMFSSLVLTKGTDWMPQRMIRAQLDARPSWFPEQKWAELGASFDVASCVGSTSALQKNQTIHV